MSSPVVDPRILAERFEDHRFRDLLEDCQLAIDGRWELLGKLWREGRE